MTDLTCETCPHKKMVGHTVLGALVTTPICMLSGEEKGGRICPHDWQEGSGVFWKDYRPKWCPLDLQDESAGGEAET